jgi:hypothetical protein
VRARGRELAQEPVALLGADHRALGGLRVAAVAVGVARGAHGLVGAVLAAVEDVERGDRPPRVAPVQPQVGPDRLAGAGQRHVLPEGAVGGFAAHRDLLGRPVGIDVHARVVVHELVVVP